MAYFHVNVFNSTTRAYVVEANSNKDAREIATAAADAQNRDENTTLPENIIQLSASQNTGTDSNSADENDWAAAWTNRAEERHKNGH